MSAMVAGAVIDADSAKAEQHASEEESAEWALVQRTGTPEAYFLYLRRNPRGAFVGDAMSALETMGVLAPELNFSSAEGFSLY